MRIIRFCDYWCTSCDGQSNPAGNCQSCRSHYRKWVGVDRCYPYCPTVSISDAYTTFGYRVSSVGQYFASANTCGICNSACNFCNGPAYTDCYSCTAGYNLVDDSGTCSSLFSTSGYGPEHSCYDSLCMSGCPTYYYYFQDQSTMNTVNPYYSWTIAATHSNLHDNGAVYYRQLNNDGVCYFCNSHCDTCYGPAQTQCNSCKRFNYMWRQYYYPHYCQ